MENNQEGRLRLVDWFISDGLAWGTVYGHYRIRDGHYIHTSEIEAVLPYGGGDYMIKTLNSKYFVKMSEAKLEKFTEDGKDYILGFEKYESIYSKK